MVSALALVGASLVGLRAWGSGGYALLLGLGGATLVQAGGGMWYGDGSAAGVFLHLLGLLTMALASYVPEYLGHHPKEAPVYAFLVPLFLLAMVGVAQAPPGLPFLFFWEGMALLGYLLVALEGPKAQAGARAFFLASRLSGPGCTWLSWGS